MFVRRPLTRLAFAGLVLFGLAAGVLATGATEQAPPTQEAKRSAPGVATRTVATREADVLRATATDTTDHQLAPDFELERMDGSTFRLSDHRGKIVVVNFWATWCPPCLEEIPGFIRLQEDLGPRGLVFVGVSTDEQGFKVVRPYAEEMDINYPLVVDDGTVAPQYGGIYALPMSFVIDASGAVRYFQPGMLPEEALRPVLVRLLDEAEAAGEASAANR